MKLFHGARLMSQSVGLTAMRVAGSGAAFVTQLLLARTMEAGDLGLFYIVTSMAIVLGTMAAIGYPGIANQLIVRYKAKGQKRNLRGFMYTARRDTAVTSIAVALTAVAAVAVGTGGNLDIVLPTAVAALAIPAFTTLRVTGGFANAAQRFALAFLPDNLIRPLAFLAILAALVWTKGSLTLLPVVGVFAVLSLLLAVAQTYAVGLPDQARGPAAAPDTRVVRQWRKSGIRLVIPLLLTSLFADLSILAAGFALAPGEVAIFGLCIKIAFMFGFFVQVVHQIAIPRFARSALARRHDEVHEIIFKTNIVAVGAMAAAALVTAIAGKDLLAIFGEAFSSGTLVLLILTATQLVRAMGGPALPLLIATGRHGRGLRVVLASLAVFLGSFAILAPALGIVGAALSVLLSTALYVAGLAAIVRRELGYRCDIFGIVRQGASPTDSIARHSYQSKVS